MGAEFVPVFLLFLIKYCLAIDNITVSQGLSLEQTLISPGQKFELGFFSPNSSGNHKYVGVWYKGISPQTVVWVANRENPVRGTDSRASLKIGDNGNLRLVDGNQSSVWSPNVHVPSNGSVATLSDNGNFVLKDGASGENSWQSFNHLGDTFLPGSVLGYNVKTGQNYVLTSWKSDSDPSLGDFTVGISLKFRPAQIFIWRNGSSTPHWRTGPWGGLKFIGLPDMATSYQSAFRLTEDPEQGTAYFAFSSFNSSLFLRLYISPEGILKFMIKENNSDWYVDWMSPKNPCDIYGVCGTSGLCKESEQPICRCLKGFEPKSKEEWSKGNWTKGCVRQTELHCNKNTSSPTSHGGNKDGFQQLRNMKLPDFYEYVNPADDINACQTWCLDNCTCSAYAFVYGIGCLIWSDGLVDIQEFAAGGEDLFLRLAHGELGGGQKNKKIIISLATVSSVVALVVILLIGLHRWRAKKKRNTKDTTEEWHFFQTSINLESTLRFAQQQHDLSELPIFDFDSILIATDYFNMKNKLGQGGFGPVYKGQLQDGTEIAVKRLSSTSGQGVEEFKNEMVLISKLQHRNLVRLVGCCIEKEERLLIYDFMPNKSLDNFIFGCNEEIYLLLVLK